METNDSQYGTFLTPREASVRFRVPIRTIYTGYQLGKIDGINVNGKCLRIFAASLIELFASQAYRRVKSTV